MAAAKYSKSSSSISVVHARRSCPTCSKLTVGHDCSCKASPCCAHAALASSSSSSSRLWTRLGNDRSVLCHALIVARLSLRSLLALFFAHFFVHFASLAKKSFEEPLFDASPAETSGGGLALFQPTKRDR